MISTNGLAPRRIPGRRERMLAYLNAPEDMTDTCSEGVTETIRLSRGMEWFSGAFGPLPAGGALLLSGDPGVGKSTLALQLAGAAATAGERVLYLSTEQGVAALESRFAQLCPATRARHYLTFKDDLYDIAALPQLLSHQVLAPGGRLAGTRLIVVDSLQGHGLSSNSHGTWRAIYEALKQAAGAGITVLALAHMTKCRAIAGPRTLEHTCDATLLLRHGVRCRSFTVPKNRFGAARLDPLALVIDDESSRLEPSPLGASSTARAFTIGPGGPFAIEAAIVPARADRGFIKAPGFSLQETETVVDLLERTLPDARFLWALGVTVRAPDGVRHGREHNLAIAAALMGALLRKAPDRGALFVGDLDLEGRVQTPSQQALDHLESAQATGSLGLVRYLISAPNDECASALPSTPIRTLADLAASLKTSDDESR
ncbi:MAG: AAA family ATPase [Sumerlaeia bacterium]